MDTTNVRVCALFWCVLRCAELNIVARVHGVWQTATMADEEAKGHDMAAAAGISFLALQQHAYRVDADLLAAVERFVDAPTHKDWCVMARRLFFLDDDVEDADIARWDDLKAWEGTSHAHRWLYNWDDGVPLDVLSTEGHLLGCQSVFRVAAQLRRSDIWAESARGMTSLEIGATLMKARVTPLVMFLRAIGGLLFHQYDLPPPVQALWVREKATLVHAGRSFHNSLTKRPNTEEVFGPLFSEELVRAYHRHPLASPQSTSGLFAREAACKQLQDVTQKIVLAKEDPQQRLQRHAFPILFAAGAPGIGKSHFLDSMGDVLVAAKETDGHRVVHVNLSFKNSTGWVSQEEDMLFDSILAARLAYAFVTAEDRGAYGAFLEKHSWAQHASAATVLDLVAAAFLRQSGADQSGRVLFAIGIDEVQELLERQTGTAAEAEGSLRLSRLFAAVGHMMQACRYPVVVVAAGVRRTAMQDAIQSSAHPYKHLELPWLDTKQRLAFFDALEASSFSYEDNDNSDRDSADGGNDEEHKEAVVQAAKETIAREHRDMVLLQNLVHDTSGLPRLLVLVAQEVLNAVIRQNGVLSMVNFMKLRGRVAARFREWRTSFATGVALSVPNLVEILAYALGHIPVRRDEPLLYVVMRDEENTKVTRTPRSAAWLEREGVATCVDDASGGAGDDGSDDGSDGGSDGGSDEASGDDGGDEDSDDSVVSGSTSDDDGSGGHGASSSGTRRERVVVLQMPWLIVQAWVDLAWTDFKSKKPSSEVTRVLKGPLKEAYKTFLWCCRRWLRLEEERFNLVSTHHGMWEAIGAVAHALRVNAYLVVRQGATREDQARQEKVDVRVSFAEFHKGALLGARLHEKDCKLLLKEPCRVERVEERFDWSEGGMQANVTQYESGASNGERSRPPTC